MFQQPGQAKCGISLPGYHATLRGSRSRRFLHYVLKKACRDVFLMPYMLRCAKCGTHCAGNAWFGSLAGLHGTLAAHADAFRKACRDVFLMPYMLRCAMCGKCAAENAWTGSLEGLRGTQAARRAQMPSRKQWAASRNWGSLWRAASALQRPRHTSPGYSGPACHHRRCNSSPYIATSSPIVPPCKNPNTGAGAASGEQRQHLCAQDIHPLLFRAGLTQEGVCQLCLSC